MLAFHEAIKISELQINYDETGRQDLVSLLQSFLLIVDYQFIEEQEEPSTDPSDYNDIFYQQSTEVVKIKNCVRSHF
jgi:hypothetical protein